MMTGEAFGNELVTIVRSFVARSIGPVDSRVVAVSRSVTGIDSRVAAIEVALGLIENRVASLEAAADQAA